MSSDANEIDRFEAHLLTGLLHGRVNARLPRLLVLYGTVDVAFSCMRKNSWLYVLDLADAFLH